MSALAVTAFILVAVVVVLLPVKVAAGWMGAERTGLLSCFFAVVLAAIVNAFASALVRYGVIVSLFVGAVAYMLVLGTTYFRALGIQVLSIVIVCGVVLLFIVLGVLPFAFFKGLTALRI